MPANPTSLLPVPYLPQLGPGAELHNNDCGAASGAMVLKAYTGADLTPDVFYDKAHPSGGVYLGVGEIQQVLSVNRVGTTWKVNQSLGNLFMALTENKPSIVLFKYSFLSDANLTESKFKGAHFAVVVGMDLKTIYMNDPLYAGTGGKAKAYPLDAFLDSWVGVSQDHYSPTRPAG
jgi:predicted double-glycine peptidase